VGQQAPVEATARVAAAAPAGPHGVVTAGQPGDRVARAAVGGLGPVGTAGGGPGLGVDPDVFATGDPGARVGLVGAERRDEPCERVVRVDVDDRVVGSRAAVGHAAVEGHLQRQVGVLTNRLAA